MRGPPRLHIPSLLPSGCASTPPPPHAAPGNSLPRAHPLPPQVIPAENLVAAFQDSGAALLGAAASASSARVMLEALEVGTAGVLLRTDDAAEVRLGSWAWCVLLQSCGTAGPLVPAQ